MTTRPSSKLALARMVTRMSQADLAKALGLSRSWVAGVERGDIVPSRPQVIAIAKVLGVDSELLFPEPDDDGEED